MAVAIGVTAEFFAHGPTKLAARIVALACYLAFTFLFYRVLAVAQKSLAVVATALALSLLVLAPLGWHPGGIDVGLVCFGVSWLVVAYMVFAYDLVPKVVAFASAVAGVAWLTFLSQNLSHALYPYNLAVGILGQITFCLWLIAFGIRRVGGATQIRV
jgi:hypothetical protein